VAVWMAVAILAFAGVAQASTIDPNDPQIIVRGGVGGTIHVTSEPFSTVISFSPNSVGPGACNYYVPAGTSTGAPPGWVVDPFFDHLGCGVINQSGSTLYTLIFNINPGQAPFFADCPTTICASVLFDPNGTFAIFNLIGLGNGDDLFIEFIGFAPDTPITFTAVVPEPGTLALMATGMGALGLLRRRKQASA
jgi:hypothetical protein